MGDYYGSVIMRKIKLHPIYIFPVILVLGLLVMVLSADAQTPPAQTTVYLPIILNGDPIPSLPYHKGIAMVQPQFQEDLTNVGADWYYTWTPYPQVYDDPKHIPMTRCGLYDDTFPTDYAGYVLVFNEPDNPEPFGCDLSIAVLVDRYIAFMDAHPNVIPVAINSGFIHWKYNEAFILGLIERDYPLPQVWGFHTYYEYIYTGWQWDMSLSFKIREIEKLAGHPIEVWITEHAVPSGNVADFQHTLDYFSQWPQITHVAVFTNRAMYDEPWWPENWPVELFNDDGSYTPMGEVYRDFH